MTKHSRLSLVERAAELYDFGAVLRAPAPVRIETEVPGLAEAPAEILDPPADSGPAVIARSTRAPLTGGVAKVDRALLAESGFIVPGEAVTSLEEEFRLVKRRLLAEIESRSSLSESKRRSVLVSSGHPDEGKSFCAVNLALSLAGEREVDVLLVDGDFSKPEALRMLGIEDGPGLVDAITDPSIDVETLVIRTDIPGLSVLPAGRKLNNVPELLASDRTRDVFERLIAGDRSRIILIDSPPALMASPATVLAALVGHVLVVVRADRTTEADLRETISLLTPCDDIALLLNGAGGAVTGRKYGAYEGYGHDEQA
jgi:protein-tyrosine kinase